MVGQSMSLKNAVKPVRIDPGTVRLIVQHLNHHATPGPGQIKVNFIFLFVTSNVACIPVQ
jgi:hypothetical protein